MSRLRGYQDEGASMMAATDRYILGDPVGVGKTRTALTAALRRGSTRAIVLSPPVVRSHWARERDVVAPELALLRVSYGMLSLQKKVVVPPQWLGRDVALLLDEFHQLKHIHSKRGKLVFGSEGIAAQVLAAGGAVYPISGTPMPRNPSELYAALWCLWHEELVTKWRISGWMDWLKRFCIYKVGPHGIRVYAAKNTPELQDVLVGKVLRRNRVQLPPLRLGLLAVEARDLSHLPGLAPETRAALERGDLPALDDNLARHLHAVGNLKAPLVAEVVASELDEGLNKVAVFAYHRSVLDILTAQLWKYGVARIDGETDETSRRRALDEFGGSPLVRVFVGQINACGTGMDGLQRACHEAVLVEPQWGSHNDVQAIGRLVRLGQQHPVQARFVSLAGTADEAVMRNHEREAAMRLQVIP